MKVRLLTKTLGALLGACSFVHIASAQITVTFDGMVAGTDFFTGVSNYSFGYDADGTGNVYKALDYGQWGRGAANSIIGEVVSGSGDFEARPNIDGANNAKFLGSFIAPLSTSSGRYVFSVDYTGADAGSSQIFLYAANSFDTSGSNDLIFVGANGGMNGFDPFIGTGSTVVTPVISYNLPDETVSGTYSVEFDYTGGDALGIAFGSYNTSVSYDNISITAVPEPSSITLVAGVLALGAIFYRRRKD